MPRARQLDLFKESKRKKLRDHSGRAEHGGEIRKGERKLRRPFDPKRPLHLVLRSTRARGAWSMRQFSKGPVIQALVYRLAERNRIKIYEYANAGNHLHVLLKAKTHAGFKKFLRTLTALVARIVTGAKKGNPVGKFWDELAYTRLVNWGKHFFRGRCYVIQNRLEAAGVIGYRVRNERKRMTHLSCSSYRPTNGPPKGSADKFAYAVRRP
jgi:hypothetical protein